MTHCLPLEYMLKESYADKEKMIFLIKDTMGVVFLSGKRRAPDSVILPGYQKKLTFFHLLPIHVNPIQFVLPLLLENLTSFYGSRSPSYSIATHAIH